jgi:iron complex transport system substrate-binding protein
LQIRSSPRSKAESFAEKHYPKIINHKFQYFIKGERKMKRMIAIVLALTMIMGLAACGAAGKSETAGTSETAASESAVASESNTPEDTTFTLEYPADMQAMGFTEPVVLANRPERVVCLSTAPVLALYELGVNMVGVPSSRVVTWPEDLAANAATVSFSAMSSDDFDYESVVALEPDLVFLAASGKDTAGAKLEELGITVYYLYAGHTVSYDSIKMQTEALINAFDTGDGAGEAIMQRFTDLENSLEKTRDAFAGKSVMVLQSGSAEIHYIQTKDGTLGSMLDMIGFENVYVNESSSMVQLDYEQALDYDPDYVVCVGATDAATHQAVMEEAFSMNPDYWNAIPAVENGNVICVDVTYCSTAGINIIDNITALIGTMSEATGIAVD